MRKRILKIAGTVVAFAFIAVAGTIALGLVITFSGVSPTVVAAQNAAISRMPEIVERARELQRENNRASAFGNL